MPKQSFFRDFSPATLVTGFVAVLVGYASSVAIILQAVTAIGVESSQIGAWLVTLGIGMGISTIALSLYYRTPILTAWSTPGIALLATHFPNTSVNEAIGIFIFASTLMLICGITGLFAKLMNYIPPSIAAAMLAGILLRFGLDAFAMLQSNFWLCGIMLLIYLIFRRYFPLYAIISTLAAGIIICIISGNLNLASENITFSMPKFVMPQFSATTLIGVGIPFFIVTMASQNAPGIATLQAAGYPPRTSNLLIWTSLMTIILTPFGGFSICIAAITAAICMGNDVHPDRDKRYIAAVSAGFFYVLAGIFGGAIFYLFNAFPAPFIKILAGLALLGTFTNSLSLAIKNESTRDVAIICFLITASGANLLGISSAFWGLVGGIIAHLIFKKRTVIIS
ncbi:benzoate/H(+) symporter BenE family transporter [Xenorhabdus cabanillasii]|uniref:Inner membrane protein ydcO n=1 Tax=Xenorhabdus cabanillasii JM26 TaxID=1427517 RepID=W1J8K0_9GAMM|nr:benzoate/H(+) symporter BenE family transporter [Xenorhabdus cabanillasii]PHM75437.1 membrane protein [Xenorhabdus cabanillasii JM26]CDL86343.1 Inner membrane protein ydcO [Xenorhabdus cabanillasii JM26]